MEKEYPVYENIPQPLEHLRLSVEVFPLIVHNSCKAHMQVAPLLYAPPRYLHLPRMIRFIHSTIISYRSGRDRNS